MRIRRFLVSLAVTVVFVGILSELASADPPDVLKRYRLIPQHSSLQVTGGFGGIYQDYDLFGKLGLVTGFTQDPVIDSPLPVLVPYAQFVDVEVAAVWSNPAALSPVIPLEHFVDLESLWSVYDAPPVLDFRGYDGQGAAFKLRAVQHGRLLHLRGTTQPICCDFFQYEINALAHQVPWGDFNYDGRVGASDYTIWRDTMGSATDLRADGNGDGIVDQADYEVWKADFGTEIDMSMPASMFDDFGGFASLAVPEPASLALVAAGAMFFRTRRRLPAGRHC
jgi:hypothetical protein